MSKRMKLVFATHNQHKLQEAQELFPSHIELLSLTDIGLHDEIPETGATLEENAILKANYVYEKHNVSCFADDTGLLVDALDGAPGVYSARYAGEQKDAGDNMDKLLTALIDTDKRAARFQTVIALTTNNEQQMFTGQIEGVITTEKKGNKGFGYDPIFRPDGYNETFAELPLAIKNQIGHRGKAVNQLITYLKNLDHVGE